MLIALILISKVSSAPPVNWGIKGMNYASWWTGEYEDYDSEDSLANLGTTGANYAGLVTTWYMTNGTSSTIWSNQTKTHPYYAIRKAIRDIHRK